MTKKTEKPERLTVCGFSSRFITITYLIYIILWEGLIVGGCGYIVFGLDRSPWWFLLALILSAGAYKPKDWKKLFD